MLTLPLDAASLRAIAVRASCDPRTVRAVLMGERVRPMTHARIRSALLEMGIPVPAAVSSAPVVMASHAARR